MIKGVKGVYLPAVGGMRLHKLKWRDMKALTEVSLRINGLSGVWATETLVESVI